MIWVVNQLHHQARPRTRHRSLEQLLTALGASGPDRNRAVVLRRRTQPAAADPADVGWAARARAAECTVWAMDDFTAGEGTVHTAIGCRRPQPQHARGGA